MPAPAAIAMRRTLKLSASAEKLWPLIANTDRFNRALGLPPVRVYGMEGFVKKVETRLYGMRLSWRELPFEWIGERYYRALREFDSGPILRFEGSMTLRPIATGCEVELVSEFTPRNFVGELLVRYAVGRRALEDASAMLRRFDDSLKDGGPRPFPVKRVATAPDAEALASRAAALHAAPVDREIAKDLLRHIAHGYDDALARMRPFELAEEWGRERIETLKVFLHAVKAGLLDMSWEVLCPNCSAAQETPRSLQELSNRSHCEHCRIEYGVDFDESVELRFSVSPALRPLESHSYCVGNPSQAPFAAAQWLIQPGAARRETLALGDETYVVRELESKRQLRLVPAADGATELVWDLDAPGDGRASFRPGEVALTLRPSAALALVRVERRSWKESATTAALVTSLQEFRDLFSSEVLAPGSEISVRTLTVFFSDLKGSTALYERIGDATAYSVVRDHFDYIFDIVRRRRGAVVKTIGDAVMAVFRNPADGVAAALEMQERVGELNGRIAPKPAVVIKIGLHQGPSIAINADGVLDYFGTTINVAARVQNESAGGDVVLTEALARDPAVAKALAGRALSAEGFEIQLKGLSDTFRLERLRPGGPVAPVL